MPVVRHTQHSTGLTVFSRQAGFLGCTRLRAGLSAVFAIPRRKVCTSKSGPTLSGMCFLCELRTSFTTSSTLVKKPSKFVKGDEAKKIIESMYKLDSPFVRYALSSSYRYSYNVYYPRSALNASYNNVVQNTGRV
jgi:hypothetical protein